MSFQQLCNAVHVLCIVGQSYQVSTAEQSTSTPALPAFHDQTPTHDVLNWCFTLDLNTKMKPRDSGVCVRCMSGVCIVMKIVMLTKCVLFCSVHDSCGFSSTR